jgi:signal transduction histidine kinase
VINQAKETVLFKVDAPKICRGFMNLIKNAYDAMPNGGTLTITTKIVDEKIVLTFTDTGEGMTPDTLRKIWSPLFTTKAKGMGFGLAICKRAVEAHGGTIWAESKHQKGTIITVELPLNLDNHEHLFEKLLEEA